MTLTRKWEIIIQDPILLFQLGLLDFGATREYRPFFVNNYFKIIDGAAKGDRDQILEYSRIVGFLTGYESKVINDNEQCFICSGQGCFKSVSVI